MLIQGNGVQGQVTGVVGAIRDAAVATGTNFQYLLATAQVESGLNPHAAAPGSSARGLFQFIDQTWLTTLKQAGPALGYANYANAITQTPSGRYEVADPAMRQQIMALRNDPTANAAMAGAFTRQNAQQLAQRLGRAPTDGELYMAHFLGPSGAGRLITLAGNSPGVSAASAFPGAARANRSIFYDPQGNPRSAAQVYGVLVGRYQTAAARPLPGSSPASATAFLPGATEASPGVPSRLTGAVGSAALVLSHPVASLGASDGSSGAVTPVSGYRSLFSDTDRGPVSQVIRDLWSTRPTVAAALTGQAAPPATTAPASGSSDGPLNLFSDRPADARGLFGIGS